MNQIWLAQYSSIDTADTWSVFKSQFKDNQSNNNNYSNNNNTPASQGGITLATTKTEQ